MRPTKHVPDLEPDKRGTRCWLPCGSVVSSISEVGEAMGRGGGGCGTLRGAAGRHVIPSIPMLRESVDDLPRLLTAHAICRRAATL